MRQTSKTIGARIVAIQQRKPKANMMPHPDKSDTRRKRKAYK